mgnify:CR=1 FL=1
MSWREIELGDAIHVKHGFAFKGEHFSDNGTHIVLTPGNFNEQGGFRLRPGKDRFYASDIPQDFILSQGDLIIAMTEQGPGLLGSSALIPQDDRFLHNQRLGLVEICDKTVLDREYLYHLFNTKNVRAQISGSASGTKVRHTAPERIYRVKVRIPPNVSEQRRIAQVLSAYGDLIENNRRRIRLLEEAARLLYREWFVRLRFPGHEHVAVVGGVPEGWGRVTLGRVAPLKYGKALKEDDRVPGPYPVYGSSGVVGTHESALVAGPGIIVGRKGNVGSVYWSDNDFCPIDTVYYIEAENASLYLYYVLLHTNFISTDVAVPGLNRNYAHGREVLIANPALMQEFESVVAPIHAQIAVLRRYNKQVSKARDLLLPKLMNGEVQV